MEEDISPDADSDDYEREQLEIALYSQIHFDESDDYKLREINGGVEDDSGAVENSFIICVQGNENIGFVANETNADIILNDAIEKKYGYSSTFKDDKREKKDSPTIRTSTDVKNSKSVRVSAPDSFIQKHRKEDSSALKEIIKSTKIHSMLRNTRGQKQEKLTTEKVIFEGDPEEDSGKDAGVIDVDEYGEDKIIFCSGSDNQMVSDSEADSLDIVLGEPDDNKEDIQMNVHSNPRYTYKKMMHEETLPGEEEQHSNDDGHWGINREDSYRDLLSAKSHRGRYYKPIRCHNCDREGHLSKNCPQPKKVVVCIMCAESGHISRNCPQAVCFNCEEPGHDLKSCTAPRRSFNYTCYRCNIQGHDQKQCPDNWRQYHVTVNPGKIQHLAKQAKRKRPSCFNCGDEGHFGHECDEERMSKYTRISTPFICRYQTVKEINYTMRRFDEAEERPLKRSRSEGWIGKIDIRTKSSYRIFDEKKPYRTDIKVDPEDFSRGKNKKKPSQCVHIAKRHSDNKTGRNNFDKLQFADLNSKKKEETLSKTFERSEKNESNMSKKKNRKKEKTDSKNFCVQGKGKGTQELHTEKKDSCEGDKEKINFHGRDSKNDGSLEINIVIKKKSKTCTQDKTRYIDKKNETSGHKFKECRNSDERTVTLDSSSNNLTILAKTDFSDVFNTVKTSTPNTGSHAKDKEEKSWHDKGEEKKTSSNENDMKGFKGKRRKRSKNLEEKSCFKQSKNSKGSGRLSTDIIKDFTVKREINATRKEDKPDRIMVKFSNKRNDHLRADDLFSLQKIDRLKSGSQFDTPLEVEDIEHQVHSNEWWRTNGKTKKRRNRRKKKNNCNFN